MQFFTFTYNLRIFDLKILTLNTNQFNPNFYPIEFFILMLNQVCLHFIVNFLPMNFINVLDLLN
jgi:hypothetical protein